MNNICFLELAVGVLLAPLIYGVLYLFLAVAVTSWLNRQGE